MGNFGNEDEEQGNRSEFNKEEVSNLNSVVENVSKSVGLVDSQEGVTFSQFTCDQIVENFLIDLNRANVFLLYSLIIYDFNFVFLNIICTEHLVEGGINEKAVEDDINDVLTGFKNNEFDEGCAEGEVENAKAKKDGQGVVESEGGEVGTDLAKGVEEDPNKNKDGGVDDLASSMSVYPFAIVGQRKCQIRTNGYCDGC
ncbi:unnamed protein product [Lactuca virosa]|uniref:Uncharacterized protein n=1 Tax=Lactuca virosa TaxID=75947 RepID=A0AAU9MEF2_9ASTR|nr:unnamed protein product [Lactuca virosa]